MPNRLNIDADTELLTAYLDNELTTQERLDLERRLVSDSDLREQLRQLRRAWELLDDMPSTNVSRDFTTTTLKLVTDSLESGVGIEREGWRERFSLANFVSRCLNKRYLIPAAAVVIFLATWQGIRYREQQRAFELDVVAAATALPALNHFENNDVLQHLSDFKLVSKLAQTDIARNTLPVPPLETSEIADWVSNLPSRDKVLLRNREDDFLRLSDEVQATYLARFKELKSVENPQQFQRIANLFASLIDSLESSKRLALQQLPPEEQARQLRQEAYFKIAMWYAGNFSKADRAAIRNWCETTLDEAIAPARWRRPNEGDDQARISAIIRWMWGNGMPLTPDEELINSLLDVLSPEGQDILAGVAPELYSTVIGSWALYALDFGSAIQPTTEELVDQYRNLTAEQRERLDLDFDPNSAERTLRWSMGQRPRRGNGNRPPVPGDK